MPRNETKTSSVTKSNTKVCFHLFVAINELSLLEPLNLPDNSDLSADNEVW